MISVEDSLRPAVATVVFDVDTPAFWENRLLDPEFAAMYPGAHAFSSVGLELRRHGVVSVTADEFLKSDPPEGAAALISLEQTRYSEQLLQTRGLAPAVVVSLESPIMAVDFYRRIPEVTARYKHSFLWPGTKPRISARSAFHPVSWPYPGLKQPDTLVPWEQRRFLTLVSSNKRAFSWPARAVDVRHPRSSIRASVNALRIGLLRLRDPWFRSEIYLDRQRAIEHFSLTPDFDLYGRGWGEASSALSRRAVEAVERSYRGEIPPLDKVRTLAKYQFALCFENTSFPGYITEKIFDALAAGCIPVYRGAPDIGHAVPADAFIDASGIDSLGELDARLRSVSPERGEEFLASARAFLESPGARRFSEGEFVEQVSGALLESLGIERLSR